MSLFTEKYLTEEELNLERPWLINGSELVAAVLSVGITCKTYPTLPRKADVIVEKVTELYQKEFEPIGKAFHLKGFKGYRELKDWLNEHLLAIPEIEELNLTQAEFEAGIAVEDENRSRYAFSGRGIPEPDKDNDFIDLGAFIGNVTHTLIRNKVHIHFGTFNGARYGRKNYENKEKIPMLVNRTVSQEVDTFEVNDIINFTLTDGEEVQAMAVKQLSNGMMFLFVDCLKGEYQMNKKNTNKGGYDESDLRKILNTEILDRFPTEIKDRMCAFGNGDLLTIPTETEIFGENHFGEEELSEIEQFESMKDRRNRIAFDGKNGGWQWYWLQNAVEDSGSTFAYVNNTGLATLRHASLSLGVRPAFKI